jgi:hypothetical protein
VRVLRELLQQFVRWRLLQRRHGRVGRCCHDYSLWHRGGFGFAAVVAGNDVGPGHELAAVFAPLSDRGLVVVAAARTHFAVDFDSVTAERNHAVGRVTVRLNAVEERLHLDVRINLHLAGPRATVPVVIDHREGQFGCGGSGSHRPFWVCVCVCGDPRELVGVIG